MSLSGALHRMDQESVVLGKPCLPGALRTYAAMVSARFEGDTLLLETAHPPWVSPDVPFAFCGYVADIATRGHTPCGAEGCERIREDADRITVRLLEPHACIRFVSERKREQEDA